MFDDKGLLSLVEDIRNGNKYVIKKVLVFNTYGRHGNQLIN